MAAIVNAVWDLHAKREKKPVWKLLADMTPQQIVSVHRFPVHHRCADAGGGRRHARTAGEEARREREAQLLREGYPAYTTSAGWIGYSDDKIRQLCRDALRGGLDALQGEGRRRARRRRARASGSCARRSARSNKLMIDANQRWDVNEAIERVRALAALRSAVDRGADESRTMCWVMPRLRRRCRPIGVATGEHAQNRIIFKQLLQAGAIDFCQIDSCRLGGVNENLAVILMAAKFGVPVCPHAGGVGLCELVQHLSMFDFIARIGTHGRSRHRVRRPSSRALRRSLRHPPRALHGADRRRVQQRDQGGSPATAYQIPERTGVESNRLDANAAISGRDRLRTRRRRPWPSGRASAVPVLNVVLPFSVLQLDAAPCRRDGRRA